MSIGNQTPNDDLKSLGKILMSLKLHIVIEYMPEKTILDLAANEIRREKLNPKDRHTQLKIGPIREVSAMLLTENSTLRKISPKL